MTAAPMTSEQMLARLVGFASVSSASNLPLIEFVRDWLAQHGVACHLVHDDTATKASLFASIGPDVPGGVVLSGHSDVVPVTGQDWHTDPFVLTRKDDRLYGRGTCDMKGFVAIALAAVPRMLAAPLQRPIQIAISHDEEVGCLGAPPMIARMRQVLPPASIAIVGEPTMMQVVTGHKGIIGLSTHVRGHEVHSSLLHTGVSAVMTAARLITWAADQTAQNAAAAGRAEGEIALYDLPYTTLHAGMIQGGTASNITARDCRFSLDIRVVPGESTATWHARYLEQVALLRARNQAIHADADITVHVTSDTPGCVPEPGGAAETLARQLTGDNARRAVSYATEGGQFQEGGYSTCICGPGSIAQAHQPNEYLDIAQLRAGEDFVNRLIAHLS